MAVTNFIPTIQSARLNEGFKKALVYGNCVNTDYEGEIKGAGSTVKINSVGAVTIEKYKIIAGQKSAISFAGQVDSVEAYRPESQFSDAVKGLQVYGAKCIKPEGIAVLTANRK